MPTVNPTKLAITPEVLGKNPVYERWRRQIFGITWLAYAGFYLTRKSFAVAKIGIGEGTEIGLTQPQMAWIDGAFLTAYAVGQFACGIAGDKLGTRKVIICGLLLSALTAMVMGLASLFWTFAVLFCVQGIAQSSGWAPLTKNISNFFAQRERGVVMGLWCTNYALGGFIATVYAGYLGQYFGWRYAFFIPAATVLVIVALFCRFQRDRPEDIGLPPIEQYRDEPPAAMATGDEREGSWKTIWRVMTNPMVILLMVVYFCLKPARYAILFWGPKYVHDRMQSGMAESGLLSSLFELAGPLSVFLAGLISDKMFGSRRMPISIICLFLLSALLFLVNKIPDSKWWLGGSLFLLGLLLYAPDSLISGTAAVDFGTKKGASTASGLINGSGSIGAIVGGTLPGFFQRQWGWDGVFIFLAVVVCIAALVLLPKWNALPNQAQTS